MASFRPILRRLTVLLMLGLGALGSYAKQPDATVRPDAPMVISGLGRGTVALNGPWQFHPGDDPAWANPAFDSSGWEQVSADRPWGKQGHARLTGFAWYRCSVTLLPAPGAPMELSLLVSRIQDAYEIYWNGSLIGRNGRLSSRPVWYYSQPAQTFALGQAEHGVLAMRVWKAPLLSDDRGETGGFDAAPLLGSTEAIATAQKGLEFQWLRSQQFAFGENLLSAVVGLLSALLWMRARNRWVLFWTAIFALVPPILLLMLKAHLGWPYPVVMGVDQPLSAARDISLWFLLLWLLHLHANRDLSRLTRMLACIGIVNGALDGVLVAISGNPHWAARVQTADALSTVVSVLLDIYPLVLVGYAVLQHKQLNSARWLVSTLVFVDEMLIVIRSILKQGRLFDWRAAEHIDSPLFTLCGSAISLYTLAGALLLVGIVYGVYSSIREDQRRQDALEREKMELVRESRLMRHQAEHDGLTGLWNHRMIVDRLREEMIRSQRTGTMLSVVLSDIDYFKQINDTFGHLAGDMVLQEVGAILTRSLRPYDSAGRYGGEEFLIILPGCEMETALLRAEQLRAAVQSARIMDGDTQLKVTASFGVASAFLEDEAESVIRAVDAALYRAKRSGRNCVVPAEINLPLCES